MSENVFKNIIQNAYGFEDVCELCGQPAIKQDIYDANYCEECFNEAQESRL